jgi:uncharacterized lipoprotein
MYKNLLLLPVCLAIVAALSGCAAEQPDAQKDHLDTKSLEALKNPPPGMPGPPPGSSAAAPPGAPAGATVPEKTAAQ